MTIHTNSSPSSALPQSSSPPQFRLKHPRIEGLRTEINSLIYPGSQSNILLVIGPTGAGKSTLMERIVDDSYKRYQVQMETDPNLVPAIYVQAPASGEGDFSWRLLYERILQQLEGSDLGISKQAFGINQLTGLAVRPRRQGRSTLAGLRTAVERSLRQRETKILVIDEAVHIIRSCRKNNAQMQIQLDTLKSLANECGTQLVLVGSYDLYDLVSLSAQISRRTHVLHFERYREDRPEDVHDFQKCLRSFEKNLPLLWDQKLVPHLDALMQNCVGCIGTLSTILNRSARRAEAAGAWQLSALEGALLTEAQVEQILTEIVLGEQAINPSLQRHLSSDSRKRA